MAHDLPKLPEEFKDLLRWLGPDKDAATDRYFSIRRGLVKMFEVRGCLDADELADETIDRVVKKASILVETYQGEPAAYFYGVAKNVFRESVRKPRGEELPDNIAAFDPDDGDEGRFKCLDKCLAELTKDDRGLIVGYYAFEPGEKIPARRSLASSLGVTMNHLRIRAFRIRESLHKCLSQCMEGV
ncbi:MAG: hypothetical protein QUS14_03880 [Pyrinomonadaceae bacterium]|nr:hypothetical protein [Pyrinomonadaceae bacterium]